MLIKLHIGFDDPSQAKGTDDFIWSEFRRVRDEIKEAFVVLYGELPESLKNEAAMYAGCVAGAQQKEEYLETIRQSGFSDIQVRKEKQITLPDEILLHYLDDAAFKKFRAGNQGIFSVTVTANRY